jgi:hypothetical protein
MHDALSSTEKLFVKAMVFYCNDAENQDEKN